jgi:hypothetical protein
LIQNLPAAGVPYTRSSATPSHLQNRSTEAMCIRSSGLWAKWMVGPQEIKIEIVFSEVLFFKGNEAAAEVGKKLTEKNNLRIKKLYIIKQQEVAFPLPKCHHTPKGSSCASPALQPCLDFYLP